MDIWGESIGFGDWHDIFKTIFCLCLINPPALSMHTPTTWLWCEPDTPLFRRDTCRLYFWWIYFCGKQEIECSQRGVGKVQSSSLRTASHKQTLRHQTQLTWRKTKSFSAATIKREPHKHTHQTHIEMLTSMWWPIPWRTCSAAVIFTLCGAVLHKIHPVMQPNALMWTRLEPLWWNRITSCKSEVRWGESPSLPLGNSRWDLQTTKVSSCLAVTGRHVVGDAEKRTV